MRVKVGPGAWCYQIGRVRFCLMAYRWTIGFTITYATKPTTNQEGSKV